MTNESIQVVTVSVDLGLPKNQDPEQALEVGEFCEVLTVEKGRLLDELRRLDADDDVRVFAGLCESGGLLLLAAASARMPLETLLCAPC